MASSDEGPAPADPRAAAARAAGSELVRDFGLLIIAASRLEQRIDAALRARCGIRHTMFEVLIALCGAPEGRLPQRALGEKLVLTSGGVTRLIDQMQEAGFVTRSTPAGDRRITIAEVTERGRTTFVEAVAVHAEVVGEHFVRPVAAADYPVLIRALSSIDEAGQGSAPGAGA